MNQIDDIDQTKQKGSLLSRLKVLYHKLGSPKYFYELSTPFLIPVAFLAFIVSALGVFGGLIFAPADYQQGDAFRIIYIHVPVAILSQSVYMLIAFCAAITLVWKMKMAAIVAKASMPLGASFALLTLITGSIWGKPTWGTWWFWGDARLMSALILLLLYLGLMALRNAFTSDESGIKASSILALVGLVNIPVLKYSVYWWNSLHQPATLKITEKPAMQTEMLIPLLLSIFGFYLLFAFLLLVRTRNEILENERNSQWVKKEVGK